jgi:hypothetical protein
MKKPTQKEQVLKLLRKNKHTALSLSMFITDFPIATIHKRIVDLYNDGIVRQTGEVITTPENKTYAMYELTPFCEIQKTIIKRNYQRNISWIMNGYTCKHINKEQRDSMLYDLTSKMNLNN